MAIKMKVSKEAVEEAGEAVDFEQAPPGLYVIKLKAVTGKFAKTDGKEDKSRPYAEAQWQIVGIGKDNVKPEKAYSGLWDSVSFSEESEWKRAQYAVALGKTPKAGEFVIEENPDKPGTDIGKLALGRVKKDQDLDGNYRAKLGSVFAFDADAVGDLAEQGEGEGGDPFSTDATETEPTALSRDYLEGLEPADIKPYLEQFDLDPTSFKGKTAIADAIDAILEAQGLGDDGSGTPEPEEESPF